MTSIATVQPLILLLEVVVALYFGVLNVMRSAFTPIVLLLIAALVMLAASAYRQWQLNRMADYYRRRAARSPVLSMMAPDPWCTGEPMPPQEVLQ